MDERVDEENYNYPKVIEIEVMGNDISAFVVADLRDCHDDISDSIDHKDYFALAEAIEVVLDWYGKPIDEEKKAHNYLPVLHKKNDADAAKRERQLEESYHQ